MDTKLTIKLDKQVIEKAKDYATVHKKSLSRLIESYLKSLVSQDSPSDEIDIEISPFVKSISTDVSIPADSENKKEYKEFLLEKYK